MKEINKLIFDNIKSDFEPESLFYVVEKPFKEFNDFQHAIMEHPYKPIEVEDKETYTMLKAGSMYSFKSLAGRVKRSVLYYHLISNLDFEANTKTITPATLKANADYTWNKYWLNSSYRTDSGKLELTDCKTGEVSIIETDSTEHLVLTETDIKHLSELRRVYLDATMFIHPGEKKINNLIPDNKVIEIQGENKIIIEYYGFLLGNGLVDESEHYDYTTILVTAKFKNPEAVEIYTLIPDE